MYTDEQIEEMFKDKYNLFDPQCKQYLDAYINIYKQSFINPCKSDKFHHHHLFPSFIYKQMIGEKNRYHTIEKLDETFKPNDNVCKLRILYHVLAHYYLAMALRGTVYEYDSLNAFCTLINDYSRPLSSYTLEEIKEIGRLIEENTPPNQIDHYMTQSETKEYFKQKQKDYMEDWAEKHEFIKQKRKEFQEKWKEEHKDEIEERKRQQREYAKQMREKYKAKRK
jgi:hypothetical protein